MHFDAVRFRPTCLPLPNRFVGPNQLLEETIQLFLDPRYGVKPSQVHVWPREPRLLCRPALFDMRRRTVVAEEQQTSCAVILCTSSRLPLPQALVKIPDTLVCAMEFIQLPTPKVGTGESAVWPLSWQGMAGCSTRRQPAPACMLDCT